MHVSLLEIEMCEVIKGENYMICSVDQKSAAPFTLSATNRIEIDTNYAQIQLTRKKPKQGS